MNSLELNKIIDYCVYWLLCLTLVFDAITGFFLNKDIPIPISQVFKFTLLGLLILRVLTSNTLRPLAIIYLYYSVGIILFFLLISATLLSETIILYSKFLLTIFVFLYFRMLFKADAEGTYSKVMRIMNYNLAVLIINIIVFGVLGIGYSQYGDSVGSKGYFFAGNELAAVLLIFMAFYIDKALHLKKTKKILLLLTLFLLAILSATKTTIFGFIILLCWILYSNRRKRSSPLKKFLKAFLIIGGIIAIGAALYSFIMTAGIVQRWTFFYEKNGIEYLIFSSRTEYLEAEIGEYTSSNPFIQLLGMGGNRTVEMDIFDVLMNFGIIGLVVVYGFFFYLIVMAYKKKKMPQYPYAEWGRKVFLLLLFTSSLAGHTIFSAMAGTFIGIAASLIFYKTNLQYEQE